MMTYRLFAAAAAFVLAVPSAAQDAPPANTFLSPGEIVAATPASDWVTIASSDLLVMDLAADAKGKPRRVVIQLMPAPFSQGWIENIRKLATAHWWDGTSVNRVQDNYVVQWGDASEAKVLPDGLAVVPEGEYLSEFDIADGFKEITTGIEKMSSAEEWTETNGGRDANSNNVKIFDAYLNETGFWQGWPIAVDTQAWPVHCYGMVGVGRNLSPDSGSGAELYTVIGHAPRHLDRNIALVGRVISGIEHLSSLPRGTGALGFYADEAERVPITSVRLASELPEGDQPKYEYLSTESGGFAHYADARANRRDPFFIRPAGGADICNIPVPVREAAQGQE